MNEAVWILATSEVSIRASSRILGLNRKTIVRKRSFLATQAEIEQKELILQFKALNLGPSRSVQMDELETIEHTKLKPVSVPLVVDAQTRFILGIDACSMPAKGLLARHSRKKYGRRKDDRKKTIRRLLKNLQPDLDAKELRIKTDSNPLYPALVRKIFPHAIHERIISRRGSRGGQGELKKIGFDPIFAINHTCAMLRANIARLIRKTWCSSKKIEPLREHLLLYAVHHNREILARIRQART